MNCDFEKSRKSSGRIYRLHLNTESSGFVGVTNGNRLTTVARDNDPVLKFLLKLASNLFVVLYLGGLVSEPFNRVFEPLLLFEVIIVIVTADKECHVVPAVVFLLGGGDGVRIPE